MLRFAATPAAYAIIEAAADVAADYAHARCHDSVAAPCLCCLSISAFIDYRVACRLSPSSARLPIHVAYRFTASRFTLLRYASAPSARYDAAMPLMRR